VDRRTTYTLAVAAVVAVLLVLGFVLGWFSADDAPPPATAPGTGGATQ
jgi:hypothetical protein